MKYKISEIAQFTDARINGSNDNSVRWLLTDSRSLCFPEETLFFALRTERNDGHKYIGDLYRRGVRNFMVEKLPENHKEIYADATFLVTDDSRRALQAVARMHRMRFDIPVIGITGSNGKTVVKEWLFRMLLNDKIVRRSPRSYNSQIGVPLSVCLIDKNTELALIEAGISRPGEMQALEEIIRPTIGIFTSLGTAHQENFKSLKEKCNEKIKLFANTESLVYCSDCEILCECLDENNYRGRRIAWSEKDKNVFLYVSEITKNEDSTHISYVCGNKEGCFDIPFIDSASTENSITCAATLLYMGIDADIIKERMRYLEPVAMRLEVKSGQHGCTIINDTYNNDFESLDIALDFMNRRPDHEGRCRTLILSDIFQSGRTLEELYKEVSDIALKRGTEKFIGIGEDICNNADKIEIKNRHFFRTCDEFISSDVFASLNNEVILIKGARKFGFEHITELLEQKVHETILEVDLGAVVENLNFYRSFLKPDTKLVCMVKADAYGSGAVEVAKTLQDHRVDYLAVAVADEGVTLRRNGITSNIMIMNPEMTAFKKMFEYKLEPEVYSFRLLDALINAARSEGITNYPVHIKLDTGMHRLGFDPEHDIEKLAEILKHQQAVIPSSIFSHFVGSDSDGFDEFSAHQFELFKKGSSKLQSYFGHHIIRHMDNSAGIEHFPERQMDMCRLGLGLYGIDSRDNSVIHNVGTLKTTILQIHDVPATETVGYSRKGILKRNSRIAAIPIGYADGLNRRLGNRNCYCMVNGSKAEYVGNICMDVAMIDVTDIQCKEGDTVEIFGEHLPVTVLSDAIGTIPYEILTGISNRVKRVYFQS